MDSPAPLAANAGLAFLGEAAWAPAILSERQAEKLSSAVNSCGRPNADVLRRRLAVIDGSPSESWQIEFPEHFTAQEAALYEQPFARLRARAPEGRWLNPHAQPDLRRALARVSRFLATPAQASVPDWHWIEEDLLPDATLLVVARDDDFAQGVLGSSLFAVWWRAHASLCDPVQRVESFPFPWPPATALSALTAVQESHRHAIARASRGEMAEQLNAAVLAAYGWPTHIPEEIQLGKLSELNQRCAG